MPEAALLPALTLQPLVENAICHGIETCREGGTIHLQGRLDHDMIILCLCNPRCGDAGPGHGLAMSNTRQRLALSFGAKARLQELRHLAPGSLVVLSLLKPIDGVHGVALNQLPECFRKGLRFPEGIHAGDLPVDHEDRPHLGTH